MPGAVYSPAFKSKMVERMLSPGGPSPFQLSSAVNVPRRTLTHWKRDALGIGRMSDRNGSSKRKRWSVEQRLRLVVQASELSEEELGAFLRREGIHEGQLEQWREALHEAFGKELPAARLRAKEDARRIRALERELQRKDKALAESAALLWLKKKALDIWGDEDDDTTRRSGE